MTSIVLVQLNMTVSSQIDIHHCIWILSVKTFNSFLALQHSSLQKVLCLKGLSHHPCHCKSNRAHRTRQNHFFQRLGNSTDTQVHIFLTWCRLMFTVLWVCTALVVQYSSTHNSNPLLYTSNSNSFLLVFCVFCSGRSSYAHFHSTLEP